MVLRDDKMSIKETGLLENRDKLEVEIVIKITIDVQGKGKDYSASLEVSPDAFIQPTLKSSLSFFNTFYQQRRMNLFIVPPTSKKPAESEVAPSQPVHIDDLNKTFKDWGIKEDGVALQFREPSKRGSAL
jgi:hypothetical protein